MLGKGRQAVGRVQGLIKDETLGLIRDAVETKGPLREKARDLFKEKPLGLIKEAREVRDARETKAPLLREKVRRLFKGKPLSLIREAREIAGIRREWGTAVDNREYFGNLIRETNRKSAGEAGGSTREAERRGRAGGGLPLEDYDSMSVRQVSGKLNDLSVDELRWLRDHEAKNKNRRTLIERLNRRIEASSS